MSNQDKKQTKKPLYIKKRIKYGAISTIVTAIFIAVIIMLNIVTSMASTRFSLKADITPQKYFEVSDQTQDFLKNLNTEVEIVVLADESVLVTTKYNKYLVEILYKYAKHSNKIKLKFINPQTNPDYISRYDDLYSGTINSGSIVVTSGERIKVLTGSDLIAFPDEYSSTPSSITAEQSLTSAVAFVSNDNPVIVTVMANSLTESGMNGLSSLLEKNGYIFETTDPATGTINENSKVVIVPAPTNDYTEAACQRLEEFLYNDGEYGKNLVYFTSPDQKSTPNIDALLATWGISVDDGFVCEYEYNYYTNSPQTIISVVDYNDFSAELADYSRPFIVPVPSPLVKLWDSNNNYTVTSLLSTTQNAYRITQEIVDDENFSIDNIEKEQFDLMLLSTRREIVDNTERSTNVLALSTPYCVASSILTASPYSNAEYLLAIFNNITGNTETGITIVPKDIEIYSISLSAAAARNLKWIMVIGIPVALLITGIVIWARRKNR